MTLLPSEISYRREVHPDCCAGARIVFWSTNLQLHRVNEEMRLVSVWNGLLVRLECLKCTCTCIIFAYPSCRLHVGHGTRTKAGKYLSLIQSNLLIPAYETRAGKSFLMSTVLIHARFQYFFVHYIKQLIKVYLSYIGSWISFSKPATYIGFSLSFTALSLK